MRTPGTSDEWCVGEEVGSCSESIAELRVFSLYALMVTSCDCLCIQIKICEWDEIIWLKTENKNIMKSFGVNANSIIVIRVMCIREIIILDL